MTRLSVDIVRTLPGARFRLRASFAAGDGTTAILGPSGAGKTMLLHVIAGLARPETGTISLDGRALYGPGVDLAPEVRDLGMVFQEPRLFPHLSVRANMLYGAPKGSDPEAAIALLGLGDLLRRRPADLSGGEAQRVAIARALLRRPKMILMDEPLSGLDPARKGEVLPHLRSLSAAEATPILYVTHVAEEAAALGARILTIDDGVIADAA
ncbi:MAG: ATP-binding cassette domain-containing protein [Pseudomonadota bacterium]